MNVSNSAINFLQTFIKISFEIDSKSYIIRKKCIVFEVLFIALKWENAFDFHLHCNVIYKNKL